MLQLCKAAVRTALRPFGLAVHRIRPQEELLPFTIYKQRGIDLVLDVGAHDGNSGAELRRHGYRGRIVSFEPLSGPYRALEQQASGDALWQCRQLALGDCDQALPMTVCSFTPASSLLAMDDKCRELVQEVGDPEQVEQIQMKRLDSLTKDLDLAHHKVLLKIDVQGYELQVLRGAAETLPYVTAAYVEVLFGPFYHSQAPYFEVMATLEHAGLKLAGIFGVATDPNTGHWLWADGLFLRATQEWADRSSPA